MVYNLSESLAIAHDLCPDVAHFWTNLTYTGVIQMDLNDDLPSVMCHVGNLLQFGSSGNDTVSIAAFCIAPIGILCSFLALYVFSSKRCSNVTFIYHRAINISDMIWLMFYFEMGVFNMVAQRGHRIPAWDSFHTIFGNRVDNCFSDFVELTVAWVAIERTSCYLPSIFRVINRKKVAYFMLTVLFILSVAIIIPYGFELMMVYDSSTQTYVRGYTTFGRSDSFKLYTRVYNGIMTCRMVLVSVGTCGTIVVFLLISRNKRHLAASVGQQSVTYENLLNQAKASQMLCVLQLCEAIPIIIKCIMLLNLQSLTVGITTSSFVGLTYTDAVALVAHYRYSMILLTSKKVVDMCSHALHFILYCSLSKRIRTTITEMLKEAFGHSASHSNRVTNLSFSKNKLLESVRRNR